MKRNRLVAGAVSVMVVCVSAIVGIQSAQGADLLGASTDSKIRVLVEANPGSSYEEMLKSAQEVAGAQGKSLEMVLNEAIAETKSAEYTDAKQQNLPRSGMSTLNSGGSATQAIGPAGNAGDVFYSPVSNLGVTHGHSGLYTTTTSIIEAPGPGKTVIEHSHSYVKVAHNTQKQHVRTSQGKRQSAVNYSRRFKGRAYNYNFAFNKTANGRMNCSQLVWIAYKNGAGIDLDSNGGNGVYPSDIMQSQWTATYQTIR